MKLSPELRASLLWNGTFLAVLYVGFSSEVLWLVMAASVFVWVMLVVYMSSYFLNSGEQVNRKAPWWLDLFFVDVPVLYLWFSNEWYSTGFAYLLSMVFLKLRYRFPNKSFPKIEQDN